MGNHKIFGVYHHFLYEHIRYPFLAIPRFQAHPFDSLWRYTFMCISRFLPARYLSKDWFQGQFRGHQCLFLLPPINMRVPICFSPRFSMIFPHTHQWVWVYSCPTMGLATEDIYEESQCRKPILYLLTAGVTDHWCVWRSMTQWNAQLENSCDSSCDLCCSLQLWRRFLYWRAIHTTLAQEVIPHSALMSWPRKRRSIPPTRCGPETLLCRACWFAAFFENIFGIHVLAPLVTHFLQSRTPRNSADKKCPKSCPKSHRVVPSDPPPMVAPAPLSRWGLDGRRTREGRESFLALRVHQ